MKVNHIAMKELEKEGLRVPDNFESLERQTDRQRDSMADKQTDRRI